MAGVACFSPNVAERSILVTGDIAPVLRLFPGRIAAIRSLAGRDDEFMTLCTDFADAEAAMRQWQASSEDIANERRLEFEALAQDLAREIEAALARAVVVSLSDRRSKAL